ncbi:MAG: hypoxanthine-guanine phosphoribosyltransferase [Legionellales bacterium]|nr:hypoxanthine-guanine phosphoribosyltransferase [Legionellales bacterium]
MTIPVNIHQVYANAKQLYTADEVAKALDQMASTINTKLLDTNPIVLCVMVGGMVTLGNLLPRLTFALELDYVHATRYQNGLSGKEVQWRAHTTMNLTGRHVLVVDDILEGGITLQAIIDDCYQQGARQVYSAVLLDKQCPRVTEQLSHADFTGLTVEDHYVFGYGLDYKSYLRNAPGIYVPAPEHR